MNKRRRVLWVEDGSRYDLVQLAAPVLMEGDFELVEAENASEGIAKLLEGEFDVIIVDIRIPPGNHDDWIRLYEKSASDKVSARLGRHFLFTILGHPKAEIMRDRRLNWIKPEMVGVFSVEGHQELNGDLDLLGIKSTNYYQKRANTPENILLTIIEDILRNVAIDN